jgi:hypothetical protein
MRVAVVGGRDFDDYDLMKKTLDEIQDVDLIVSGGSEGADNLAERYAYEKSIKMKVFKPNWNMFGRQAGFLRNIDIINNADMVVAFWDGMSRGTKHSIDIAKKGNIKTVVVEYRRTSAKKENRKRG